MDTHWNILFTVKEAYSSCIHPICEKYGINLMAYSILMLLADNAAQNTAQELANTYHLSKSHISTSLTALENKGYIQRLKKNGQRKNIHIKILPAGFEVVTAGKSALGDLAQVAAQGFSEQEALFLNNSLIRLNDNLERYIQGKQEEKQSL